MSARRQQHLKVYWLHDRDDEPSVFFYEELDGWVTRVIELWGDGSLLWADGPSEAGGARFPDQPLESDDWVNSPEFSGHMITAERFETLWSAATAKD